MLTGISRFIRCHAFVAAALALQASGCSWRWNCCMVRQEPYGCHDCEYVGRRVTHRPLNVWQYTSCGDLWKDHCDQAAARGSRQHSDCSTCNESAWRGLEQHYTPAMESSYDMSGTAPAVRPLNPPVALPVAPIPAPLAPPVEPAIPSPADASPVEIAPPSVLQEATPGAAKGSSAADTKTPPRLPPSRPITAPPAASPLAQTPVGEVSPAIESPAIESPVIESPVIAGPAVESPASPASASPVVETPVHVKPTIESPAISSPSSGLPAIVTPVETPKNAIPVVKPAEVVKPTEAKSKDAAVTSDVTPHGSLRSSSNHEAPSLPDALPEVDSRHEAETNDEFDSESSPEIESIKLPRNDLPNESSIRLLAPTNRTAFKRQPTNGETSSRRGYR